MVRKETMENPTATIPIKTASPAAAPSPNGADAGADDEILAQLELVIIRSRHSQETFYDGFDSRFSHGLHSLIDAHGVRAIDALRAYMDSDRANGEYVGEAMKQLGEREDEETHAARLGILTDCLFSVPDAVIRDAVSLGIAAMDDPAALKSVEIALANEPTDFLRYSFTLVVEQLRETKKELEETKCRASSE